ISSWRTTHTLTSCPPPTPHPTHTQCGGTSETWRKGNLYSPELTQRKSSPGQKTVSNRKTTSMGEDRPRKVEGLSSGHAPALCLKRLPNLPNSAPTINITVMAGPPRDICPDSFKLLTTLTCREMMWSREENWRAFSFKGNNGIDFQ
uniref:Uncharacterized protein n=2 Tax=Canis lupus familiaris TaxID=9615 RepID=A0A8C0S880_CANLF